jgi:hypothetical protein
MKTMSDENEVIDSGTDDLAHRFARDLVKRAEAAGAPRTYFALDVGAAVRSWIERHGAALDADVRSVWLRHAELLDDAVIECSLRPGHLYAQIIPFAASSEHVLRELGALASAGLAVDDVATAIRREVVGEVPAQCRPWTRPPAVARGRTVAKRAARPGGGRRRST